MINVPWLSGTPQATDGPLQREDSCRDSENTQRDFVFVFRFFSERHLDDNHTPHGARAYDPSDKNNTHIHAFYPANNYSVQITI